MSICWPWLWPRAVATAELISAAIVFCPTRCPAGGAAGDAGDAGPPASRPAGIPREADQPAGLSCGGTRPPEGPGVAPEGGGAGTVPVLG